MTAPLDYASPTPWYRRSRVRRAIIWLTLLLALAVAGHSYGPATYRRCRIIYWQNRCLNHRDPPGTVVVNETNAPFSEFIAANPEYRSFCSAAGYPRPGRTVDTAGLFLHSRKTSAGERLVALSFTGNRGMHGDYDILFECAVFRPGTLWHDPEAITRVTRDDLTLHIGDSFRAFAAQPDPTDDSAFTLPFDLNSTRHEARFRLTPAGDAIELVSITPPL
jgi:hypothetical protein